MGTNRRQRLKPRRAALTGGQRTELTLGFVFDGEEGFTNDAERQAAWAEFKDILTPEFCKKHPGQKPWGFWKFDNPDKQELAGSVPSEIT